MQNETTKGYTHYGLTVVERDGIEYAVAENDAAADAAARQSILESLWAVRADFLQRYIPALQNTRARIAFDRMQGELCEDASDLVRAMLGDKLDEMVRDAIATDGRGHFLSPYDGCEVEEGGRFLYRIN